MANTMHILYYHNNGYRYLCGIDSIEVKAAIKDSRYKDCPQAWNNEDLGFEICIKCAMQCEDRNG